MTMASFEPFQLIDKLIEETKTFHFDCEIDRAVEGQQQENLNTRESCLLPEKQFEGKELFHILKERTATRFYDQHAIDLSDLGTILATVKEEDNRNWARQIGQGIDITVSVITWRVQNLRCPFFYDYCAETHSLKPMGEIPEQEKADDWFLQKEFVYAPAIIIINGTMNQAVKQYGGHGYRHLMVRGGAAAQNAWLSALTLGLQGTIFAGALPRPLREYTPIDGRYRTQLCAFSFGKPLSFSEK